MTVQPKISAGAIPVRQFREILIWPLALQADPASATRTAIDEAVGCLGPTWSECDDLTTHISAPPVGDGIAWDADRFAEAAYFHEFVQDFLFTARQSTNPPIRLFRRVDITGVDVTLAGGTVPRTLSFAVERLNFYLFCTGAAVLVIELRSMPNMHLADQSSRRLNLADVQDFHEQFRRTYVPFGVDGGKALPALVPRRVTWRFSDGRQEEHEVGIAQFRQMVQGYLAGTTVGDGAGRRRSPPLFDHWRALLPGALPLGSDNTLSAGSRWHAVMDERMPTVLTVSVTADQTEGPEKRFMLGTHDDDFVRLCFADSAGDEPAMLYDVPTIDAFFKRHAYSTYRSNGSLYLASGYAFVAYGAGCFFDTIVAEIHMRRHYFQIGLLLHLELASLLGFSSRITRAVAAYGTNEPERFEQTMHSIESEYLQFIHRFRFTGASNHLQAHELTQLWRRNLRLAELFEDLHTEITSATQFLFNRAASRSADTVERLTVIGTLGLVVTVTLGLLGACL